MPKGKTKSKLSLSERREAAFDMYLKGSSVTEVAKALKVSRQTATDYKQKYEEKIKQQAAANPMFLQDVLTNTIRAMEELDRIRADAWDHMKPRKERFEIECKTCGVERTYTLVREPSDQTRATYHNVLLKAQDQRAKLFGLLGVKQEFFMHVQNVNIVQTKLLEWMQRNLCEEDRDALARFMETELREYMQGALPQAIDVEAIELTG